MVVLVTGYCTPNGSDVARQFVQSFFLAVQVGSDMLCCVVDYRLLSDHVYFFIIP